MTITDITKNGREIPQVTSPPSPLTVADIGKDDDHPNLWVSIKHLLHLNNSKRGRSPIE
jgi:hypothetical protein